MPKLNKPRTTTKTPAKKDRKSLPPAQASGNRPIPYRLADTSMRGLRREALGREVHAEAEDAVRREGGVPPSWESEADNIRETSVSGIDALAAENAALRADLARIYAELGLPPDIGPALAAIREMRRSEQIHVQIATLFNAWANGDEPEGPPSSRRTLLAIGDCLGVPF